MTDYESTLGTIGAQANAEIADLNNRLTTCASNVASLQKTIDQQTQTIAQQQAQIEDLEKQLEDAQNPTPPNPTRSHWRGTSLGVEVTNHPGPFDVVRVYLQPGDRPTTWDADKAVKDGFARVAKDGYYLVSGKDAPDTWVAAFLKSCKSKADSLGIRFLYCQNHEYGNDGPNDTFPTAAQITEYKRRWDVVIAAAKTAGVETTDIQLGSQSKAEWDSLYIPGATYVGFDRYNPGIQKPAKYVSPATVFAAVVAYAKEKNKALVIGETGTGLLKDGSDPGTGRAEWTAKARTYLSDPANNVRVVAWWNQGGCAHDANSAKAWFD